MNYNMKGFDFMISKPYEGNKSLKGLTKITPALEAKIRRILSGKWRCFGDEDIILFSGINGGENAYIRFFYKKHEIAADVNDGIITVFEFDYYGDYFWAEEARKIGEFQF